MNIKLLVEGGNMKPGPSIAQQLGPLGINMGKVISEINQATQEFRGMKVPVELDVDEKTKKFKVKTFSPPTSELLKKELNLEKGSAKISEMKVGNASIEDVIKIVKIKYSNMLEKDFKKAVKSVLGTCASIGILVENSNPKELVEEIEAGKFSREIEEQITETAPEKRKKLNDYFNKIQTVQAAKLEAEKKAAEEAEAKAGEVKPEEKAEKTKTLEKVEVKGKKEIKKGKE